MLIISKLGSSILVSGGDVVSNGTSLLNDVFSELSQDVLFSGNFSGLGFVLFGLSFTPGSLGSEGNLSVFEVNLVVFKGFSQLFEEGLGGGDKRLESSLLISKGYLLVGQGGKEGFPISLSLIFVLLSEFLLINDGLSDGGQKI